MRALTSSSIARFALTAQSGYDSYGSLWIQAHLHSLALPSPPAQMDEALDGVVTEKRKPVFVKVDALRPGTNGHNLTVKVPPLASPTEGASVENPKPTASASVRTPHRCFVHDGATMT